MIKTDNELSLATVYLTPVMTASHLYVSLDADIVETQA